MKAECYVCGSPATYRINIMARRLDDLDTEFPQHLSSYDVCTRDRDIVDMMIQGNIRDARKRCRGEKAQK